jgi:L-amino acid N-acyltransferase YncA
LEPGLKLLLDGRYYRIYEFNPTVLKLFYDHYEPFTLKRRIRFLMELVRGYKVYYLDVSGTIVAYSVISRGGGRYSFAAKNDIVVGPYFVREKYRGRRYSELLVSELLHCGSIEYDRAYAWIKKDNIPSLRCSLKVGFEIVGSADLSRVTRRICLRGDRDGDYLLLRKDSLKSGAATG